MGDVKSRRGVYKDLEKSPYEYKSPYGDLFKFSSQKKLEIYTRDLPKEIDRLEKLVARYDLVEVIPIEILNLLRRTISQRFYERVER